MGGSLPMIPQKINEFLWPNFHGMLKILPMLRLGLMLILVLFPSTLLFSDQSLYQRDGRERINQAAERIFISESTEAPRPYVALGSICEQAKQPQDCQLRIKRLALYRGGDGIIDFKFSGEILSEVLSCQGTLVKWQDPETQPSPESAENLPETPSGDIEINQ